MKLKHFSKTVIGLVRKANEDHIGSLTNDQTNGNGDVFVVCDGMGGHVGGATASKKAVECILEYFKNDTHPNPILALEEAISFANEQIFSLSQDNPELNGMGTTCTALLQKDDNVHIAHVGDSRIYLNTDSKLYRVTKDHSFVQKLVDAGQLADSEMENHPRKNELTRALGISSNVEVEVSKKPLIVKNGDKFLMCSDGLCGLVNDPTISHVINKEKGFEAVDELIQLALNAGGNDNISVDIIEVVSSPHLKTVFKDQANNNSNLSETQVFDASTFKKDRNLPYVLNRYKYYVLSFLIIIMSSIYLISSDLLGLTPPSTSNPNEGNTGLSSIDSTNINPLVNQEGNSTPAKKNINNPKENISSTSTTKAKEKKKKKKKRKRKRRKRKRRKRKRRKRKRRKRKRKRRKRKRRKRKRRKRKEKEEEKEKEEKEKEEKEEKRKRRKRRKRKRRKKKKKKKKRKRRKRKKRKRRRRKSKKRKINLEDRIEKSSHCGEGKMHQYKEGDIEINIIYLKEKKVIDSLHKKDYQLSDKKVTV